MRYEFAPMEGITGYVYRNAHHQFYKKIDRYFTPFITPNQTRKFTSREMNDVLPEHNQGIEIVPQILTNKAEDFLWASETLRDLGYEEVNLNLGCPSGTVVTKKRGAGFLAFPVALDAFLEEVCNGINRLGMKISVKTRVGKDSPDEWEELLEIYSRYPLSELIVHPRIQTDFYRNHPNLDAYELAAEKNSSSKISLTYNGDLFSIQDFENLIERFPNTETVMMGRGLLTNPALAEQIEGMQEKCGSSEAGFCKARRDDPCFSEKENEEKEKCDEKQRLRKFHDALLAGYSEAIPGDRNVLFKMKELWFYFGQAFENDEKALKQIRKAVKMDVYRDAVAKIFSECELKNPPGFQ